ncbi:uncharacterized protein LOC109822083 [Asparagus officinalis]|uniref:uncharacterized protein LOC109822083 n=1 Tax=Asparagus officinalis TaxID=4686 RepID=UPI00098E069A|nr:uncharacterized protein LOC109822083 [Asparagus officinalis]
MGFMFRVRLSAFFAGAAAASVGGFLGGFYYLYKDYMIAQQAISQQVKDSYDSLEGRYEALTARVAALENSKTIETTANVEGSE